MVPSFVYPPLRTSRPRTLVYPILCPSVSAILLLHLPGTRLRSLVGITHLHRVGKFSLTKLLSLPLPPLKIIQNREPRRLFILVLSPSLCVSQRKLSRDQAQSGQPAVARWLWLFKSLQANERTRTEFF